MCYKKWNSLNLFCVKCQIFMLLFDQKLFPLYVTDLCFVSLNCAGPFWNNDTLTLKVSLMMCFGLVPLLMLLSHGPWILVCWCAQTKLVDTMPWLVLSSFLFFILIIFTLKHRFLCSQNKFYWMLEVNCDRNVWLSCEPYMLNLYLGPLNLCSFIGWRFCQVKFCHHKLISWSMCGFCPMVNLHVFAHFQNCSHSKFYPVNSFKVWSRLWHCIECDMKGWHKCHTQCGLFPLQEQILTFNCFAVFDYVPLWVVQKLTWQDVIYPNFELLFTNIESGSIEIIQKGRQWP